MYSPKIIERNIARLYDSEGIELIPLEVGDVRDYVEHLDGLIDHETGDLKRDLTKEERQFIENELRMSRLDFRYWAERYAHILSGEGAESLILFKMWGSQDVLLNKLGSWEEEMWRQWEEQIDAGFERPTVGGLCAILHKSRQLGATMVTQLMMHHRTILYEHVRALTASIDEDMTTKVYDRYLRCFDNLPWWMKPSIKSKTQSRGISFRALDSYVSLQNSKQTAGGVGQGEQWDVSHLTECASWEDAATQIEYHFFPTIKRSPDSLCILESTAQGRTNWWFNFTERVRFGDHPRFKYVFIPWYAELAKHRLYAPVDWSPNEFTLAHAKQVELHSAEFVGHKVDLTRENLYWYEMERKAAYDGGTLNLFLTNFCATPEESFQHTGQGAFSVEVLDRIRQTTQYGTPYEILERSELERITNHNAPVWEVPNQPNLFLAPTVPHDKDPRGLVWIYDLPDPNKVYSHGIDVANGLADWSRAVKNMDDRKIDNGAIEVVAINPGGQDVQVAEFAAPIDPETLAFWAALLGRIYRGRDESGEAQITIEVHPGPGIGTQTTLIHKYGYSNFYRWQTMEGFAARPTMKLGWYATMQSNIQLWAKSKRHITLDMLKINSPYLLKEMSDCEIDPTKKTAAVPSSIGAKTDNEGMHDDRVRAIQIALWAAHSWHQNSIDASPLPAPAQKKAAPIDLQATGGVWVPGRGPVAVTSAYLKEQWDAQFASWDDD